MSVEVITFGCRLNAVESEAMRQAAAANSVQDLVIVNTCAVTAEAMRQARQAIRKARRAKPDATIVVTGCGAQIDAAGFAAMPEIDRIIGNEKKTAPETWAALATSPRVAVTDILAVKETAHHLLAGFGSRARAFVKVQDGCDHRCTFCVIPLGRGNSRSVPMGAVVDQVRHLVEAGIKEIVLTGVDMTSYGRDLPGTPALGTLARAILRHVPDLPRRRLSSIDAAEADPTLRAAFAEEERLMPHLHLSLQAGDDLVLKRMKRRHSRADAIRFCAEMRALRPNIVFGADLITGFPTEDEAMFARSLDLVEECDLTWLHIFPYSPRPGTPAARMPQVPRAIAKERARRLIERGRNAVARHLAREVGATRSVLAETAELGRTEGFAPVKFAAPKRPGLLAPMKITACAAEHVFAA
jgi:threonylcarbamoyladenosine tRNA methylthiotransferase MtaB